MLSLTTNLALSSLRRLSPSRTGVSAAALSTTATVTFPTGWITGPDAGIGSTPAGVATVTNARGGRADPGPAGSVRHRSSRSTRGLFDGKDVRFGNNVPFSMKKTRRRWNPNVFEKRVYSEVLDEMINFHITASALRSIDKAGGLDNYLLTSRHVSTKGKGEGQKALNMIKQKLKHQDNLKQNAEMRGEVVESWDRIELVGKKIKQPQSPLQSKAEEDEVDIVMSDNRT